MRNVSDPPRQVSQRRQLSVRPILRWLPPVICLITIGAAATAFSYQSRPAPREAPPTPDLLAVELERRLRDDVLPLVYTYCLECHTGDRAKGDVHLDSFADLSQALAATEDLAMARELLATHEMPPKDKAQPSEHERLIMVQWLEALLKYVPPDAAPDPGWFTIHRLNRSEYQNTVRDLLGIDPNKFNATDRLPPDDTGYGFDNNADVLTISPLALEQYLEAAEDAIENALGPILEVGDVPKEIGLQARSGGNSLSRGGAHLYSNGAADGKHVFPATADYKIRVLAWENHAGDENARLSLRLDGTEIQAFSISGTQSEPQELEVRARIESGSHTLAAHFTNDYWKPDVADRNLAVEWITVAGPLDEATTDRPQAWRNIFGETAELTNEDSRVSVILDRFVIRAYRRPSDVAERDALFQLYRSRRESGAGFEEAVRTTLIGVLVSPSFLYRSLANPNSDEPATTYRLNGYELASRLSYFLWSSMPDEPLLELARNGELADENVLRAQVRRMVADPRTDAFIQNFAGQWLQLRTLDTLAIDNARFPVYDEFLRSDMVSEAVLFFGDLVRNSGSVRTLIDSDYSFLNGRLATLYGVEGVQGAEFRRVSLPPTAQRGGVLTMAGVLAVTSNTTRTSPVKRGLFVLDQILGTPPPPPPADIPPLEQAATAGPDATLRERLAAHVANPTCAVCHNRLDPIGLAFENFDAIGRWRDEEGGKAIDASGTLPGGLRLSGAGDLKTVLLSREDQVIETLSSKILTYAIGRGLEPFDRPAVRSIAEKVQTNGGRIDTLIESVVLSDSFRTCRGREPRK